MHHKAQNEMYHLLYFGFTDGGAFEQSLNIF